MKSGFRSLPKWAVELTRFGVVGVVGFVANAASLLILARFANLYVSGLFAWVIAATVTWHLNRIWTFAGRDHGGLFRQWLHFLGANSFGAALYYATYASAIGFFPFVTSHPVLAVAAGSVVGLIANFTLSRRLVFR